MRNFADRLVISCKEKNSIVCVGIDPRLEQLPPSIVSATRAVYGDSLEAAAEAFAAFGRWVIDAVADVAACVKPQSAFFERLGPAGMKALREVIGHAHQVGLPVILDAKRSDIGSTAEAYATAFLGEVNTGRWTEVPWGADAVTVNPYLGSDGLKPFTKCAAEFGKGLFVLVKTSNPSSGELQDLDAGGKAIYEHVAQWVAENAGELMGESGYSSLGAVVGATYPEQLGKLREIMPKNVFLIPGYGAQGGGAADVKPGLNADGLGAVVNASRSIIFAFDDETNWTDRVREAALRMRDDLNEVRR